ncbi:MAG: hypothetical protein U0414_10040 [Polyangiaceae bacterium]
MNTLCAAHAATPALITNATSATGQLMSVMTARADCANERGVFEGRASSGTARSQTP